MQERETHPLRTTVWCGFWAGKAIGPFFFETDEGSKVAVNGERYRNIIFTQLWPNLEELEIDTIWFQQDGATCNISCETFVLLDKKFPERVISLHGDKKWNEDFAILLLVIFSCGGL